MCELEVNIVGTLKIEALGIERSVAEAFIKRIDLGELKVSDIIHNDENGNCEYTVYLTHYNEVEPTCNYYDFVRDLKEEKIKEYTETLERKKISITSMDVKVF